MNAVAARAIVIDTRTGRTGEYEDWVNAFARVWRGGRTMLGDFMSLMGENVRLSAPGLRSTQGHAAGHEAFKRTFAVLPDLTATVDNWAAHGDVVFIEMTFSATIGGHLVKWRNVDRFTFSNGVAVERVAFFNPLKVRRAFLRNPKGWMQLVRRLRSGL